MAGFASKLLKFLDVGRRFDKGDKKKQKVPSVSEIRTRRKRLGLPARGTLTPAQRRRVIGSFKPSGQRHRRGRPQREEVKIGPVVPGSPKKAVRQRGRKLEDLIERLERDR